MRNTQESYEEVGQKCGRAVNVNDASQAQSWREYLSKMLALETKDDAKIARAWYDAAYKQVREDYLRIRR